MRRGKLVLILIGLLGLIASTAAGLYFTGALQKLLGQSGDETQTAEKKQKPKPAGPPGFMDLPELLITLDNRGARSHPLLRLIVSLQFPVQDDASHVQVYLPRIIDVFQVYLRNLGVSDVKGAENQQHLRDEMLTRVNGVIAPLQVDTLLFREFVVE
jgi:flagellar FliL protein